MDNVRWGYSLSVLEGYINGKAGDPEANWTILDRQIQLAHIERLEHIAIALENLSDVGDVVASKLTFGTVPGEGSYADGAAPFSTVVQDPGMTGPATVFGSSTLPFCDAPGCKQPVVHHGVVDGIGRRVCIIHAGMLNPNPDTPLGGDDAK